jgi:hypothetical protein
MNEPWRTRCRILRIFAVRLAVDTFAGVAVAFVFWVVWVLTCDFNLILALQGTYDALWMLQVLAGFGLWAGIAVGLSSGMIAVVKELAQVTEFQGKTGDFPAVSRRKSLCDNARSGQTSCSEDLPPCIGP